MLACGLVLLLGGCLDLPDHLTMVSQDHRRDFKQTFSHAYAALNDNGDFDVVLVHDANSDGAADTGGILKSAPVVPRQVVHIRVFWLPQSGARLDHPVSTNASIRWYVFGDRPDEAENLLEYSGSGLVLVDSSAQVVTVTIRGAFLKAVARRGPMADPLGPSTVDGTVTALLDPQRVDDLLNEIRAVDPLVPGQASTN